MPRTDVRQESRKGDRQDDDEEDGRLGARQDVREGLRESARSGVRPGGRHGAKARVSYRCQGCGAGSPRWRGRCGDCGEWNSFVEEAEPVESDRSWGEPRAAPIGEVPATDGVPRSTGVGELDRVLGGGLVAGSVTLVGGEPGIGKSTLLLQALGEMARRGARVLLVCAEESAHQVRLRAERLGALAEGLYVVSEGSVGGVLAEAEALAPDVLAVDSIQALVDDDASGAAGSVAQVRLVAQRLARAAKADGPATVLVGQVTKDGGLAGPRALEHLVDTVLSFEGDRHHALRTLHALKHRYGSTEELGVLKMTSLGLEGVADPSAMLLADRREGLAGSIVVPVLEGVRPLLVEVQALVGTGGPGGARRSAQGLDPGRLALLLAVLDARAGLALAGLDVFASVAGGVKVSEAGADLGVLLAVAGAAQDRALPSDLVVLGEVGLGGEIRQAARSEGRLGEAARLGFCGAIVPESTPDVPGLALCRVTHVSEALEVAGLLEGEATCASFLPDLSGNIGRRESGAAGERRAMSARVSVSTDAGSW